MTPAGILLSHCSCRAMLKGKAMMVEQRGVVKKRRQCKRVLSQSLLCKCTVEVVLDSEMISARISFKTIHFP